MKKKLLAVSVLVGLLSFNTSTIFAAPVSTNPDTTGRTEQNRQTGVITPDVIQMSSPIYHNSGTTVTLTGKVVIDGPKLVLNATGTDTFGNSDYVPAEKITVLKTGDKTYTYSVTVDPSTKLKGIVTYTLDAKTIYINGQRAGDTHTTAASIPQSFHVAYVTGFDYSAVTWGTYDRANNQYDYSYDIKKIWDDATGIPDDKKVTTVTGTVSGRDSISIQGSDPTFDGIEPVKVVEPPVNVQSFDEGSYSWTYNDGTKRYDLSFTLITNLSNGNQESDIKSVTGVEPSTEYTFTANDDRSPGYFQNFSLTVPEAQKPEISTKPVEVAGTVNYTENFLSEWDGNSLNAKESFDLTYQINGTDYRVQIKNVQFLAAHTQTVANFEKSCTYNDEVNNVKVTYNLKYIEPTKSNGNGLNDNHIK